MCACKGCGGALSGSCVRLPTRMLLVIGKELFRKITLPRVDWLAVEKYRLNDDFV